MFEDDPHQICCIFRVDAKTLSIFLGLFNQFVLTIWRPHFESLTGLDPADFNRTAETSRHQLDEMSIDPIDLITQRRDSEIFHEFAELHEIYLSRSGPRRLGIGVGEDVETVGSSGTALNAAREGEQTGAAA